jgi:uncharacterized caspase-like protein
VAAVLERLGFRVLKGTDLERDAMVDLVEEFARAASEADVALAYFAGHGLQVRDVNYLIPVDGRVQDEFGLRRLVRLDELIEDTGRARKLALVVVDACRDNPFVAGLQRSLGASRAASVGGGWPRPRSRPPRRSSPTPPRPRRSPPTVPRARATARSPRRS